MALYGPWQQPANPVEEFEQGYGFTSNIRQRQLENALRQQQLAEEQQRVAASQQLLQQERERMTLVQKAEEERAAAAKKKAEIESTYPSVGSIIIDPATGKQIGIWGAGGKPEFFPPSEQVKPPKAGTIKVPVDESDPKKGTIDISLDDPLFQKWASLPQKVTTAPPVPEVPKTRIPTPFGWSIPIPFTGTAAQPAVIKGKEPFGIFLQQYPQAVPRGTAEPSIGDLGRGIPAVQSEPSVTGDVTASAAGLPNPIPDAPVDATQRQVGQQYILPNGKIGIWRGQGWELAQ